MALGNWRVNKNKEVMEAAGACTVIPVYFEQATGNACHQHGTARMGNDPAKSVLDKWGRAHDADNLYVLDGSGFPTGPGVNPTLTIMANAWCCAEHLLESHANGADRRRLIVLPKGRNHHVITGELVRRNRRGGLRPER